MSDLQETHLFQVQFLSRKPVMSRIFKEMLYKLLRAL